MIKVKIIIISSGQPSANPRMVKEAISLSNAGYDVRVIWCPISPWADKFDIKLFHQHAEIKWIKAGYHYKKQPLGYFYSRIRQKYWQLIYKHFGNISDAAIKSLVLFSQELKSSALKYKSDIYIGHNLGSLFAIVSASKKFNAKLLFDFEDYHRGEYYSDSFQQRMIIDVENRCIPFIHSLTSASPFITDAYQSIFPKKNIVTINNVFPLSYAVDNIKQIPSKPLKLIWFSQYIGKKRGLEIVLKAVSLFHKSEISLTLLGNLNEEMKNYYSQLISDFKLSNDQISFIEPVEESAISDIASLHHIGISSDYSHIENRDLCLTNKIFIYLLSGNALLLSNTFSQQRFLNENKNVGFSYEQNSSDSIFQILKYYINNPELLTDHRTSSHKLALDKYNWGKEEKYFLFLINNLLSDE